ncbi:MAG: 1-acyl-sn-glycerol-3-phosphate acyltransferase [Holophagales bacterium]|nr:1-acyl-sn-glycerol-3-phosphate acyltransferase [Holophagales bacterium]
MGRILAHLAWLPINLLQWIVGSLWSAFCISLALALLLITGNTRIPLGMARWLWSPVMIAICFARVEVEGMEELDWSRPYFIAANHQSYLDIAVLFRHLPANLHFVVKSELSHVPFLAWYIRGMGMIFVDRSNPDAARRSVQRVATAAENGKTILLFPEGTRSRDGSIGQLKSGMLAAAAGGPVPLLPVALEGPGRILPPGFGIRPGKVRMRVGSPISTESYRLEHRRRLADHLREELVALHTSIGGRSPSQ